MKGSAILYNKEQCVIILENIDKSLYEELKKQCGCKKCSCLLEKLEVDFGSVTPILWHEDEIDWEYGY